MQAAPYAKTTLLDWVAPEGPVVTHVRSTMLGSSLGGLRELGYFERYEPNIATWAKDKILLSMGPEWLDVKYAVEHYRACDAMQLSEEQLWTVGEAVGTRLMGTFLGTLVRKAGRGAGISPIVAFKAYDKLWSRAWQGGALRIEQTGPKDLVGYGFGNPCAEFRYFQVGHLGMTKGSCALFAKTVYVNSGNVRPGDMIAKVSWV